MATLEAILSCLLIFFVGVIYAIDVPEPLHGGNAGNPGVKCRITKKGFEYCGAVAGRILDEQIPKIQIRRLDRDFSNPVPGHLVLTDLAVTNFKAPEAYSFVLQPTDKVGVSARNMDFSLQANYAGTVNDILGFAHQSSGSCVLVAKGVTVALTVTLDKTADGKPQFKSAGCTTTVASASLDYTSNGNIADVFFLNTLKPILQLNAQSLVQQSLCEEVQRLIDNDLNRKFSTMAATIPLQLPGQSENSMDDFFDVAASDQFSRNPDIQTLLQLQEAFSVPLSNFTYDYKLTRKPVVDYKFIETSHKGLISYVGDAKIPFYSQQLPSVDDSSNKMFYASISDYVFNTGFYAAYKQNNTLTVNRHTMPKLQDFLKTTCSQSSAGAETESSESPFASFGSCFGEVFQPAAEKFPNHFVGLNLQPSAVPYILISDSVVKTFFDGALTVVGWQQDDKRKSRWITANVVIEGECDFSIKNGRIFGHMTSKDQKINVVSSVFDSTSNDDFETLAKFASELIEEKVNDQLSQGIPIPLLKYGTLVNTEIMLKERALLIASDVELNEERLRDKAMAELASSLDSESNNGF